MDTEYVYITAFKLAGVITEQCDNVNEIDNLINLVKKNIITSISIFR